MTAESHLVELERKHRALDEEIMAQIAHPSCDDVHMAELKRRKLRLKDEIAKLRGHRVH